MKHPIIFISLFLVFNACSHSDEVSAPAPESIPGGNGGTFHIAIFTLSGKTGVSGKCYLKYACKTILSAPVTYNDSSATMTEPGYGPHVHFVNLKEGFYLLSAKGSYNSNKVSGDTIIEILPTQPASKDYYLQLK